MAELPKLPAIKRVWKYRLKLTAKQTIEIPFAAKMLKAGVQDGMITIWALVHPNFAKHQHSFRIAGTGDPVEEPWAKYIDTVFNGDLVWHIFDLGPYAEEKRYTQS